MLSTGLTIFGAFTFYIVVGLWCIYLRWPLRGGLAMAIISLVPLLLAVPVESEAPGSGLPTALMLMPALLMIAVGLAAAIVRWIIRPSRKGRRMERHRSSGIDALG